jgi:adenine deaminase
LIEGLKNRIRAARGEIAPDLILKGGRVINVFSHEVLETDAAIHDGIIVRIGEYEGDQTIDIKGQYLCPGFIDGHFPIESTMLTPPELAKAVLPHGTTTIIADPPHEIATVRGRRGIHYIIESSKGLPNEASFGEYPERLNYVSPYSQMPATGSVVVYFSSLRVLRKAMAPRRPIPDRIKIMPRASREDGISPS